METGMLNPFHNEEGQFGIDRDPQETSPWGSDHDVHENHLTSSDGKEEDFRRTLHDWRRHVDAFPMPDTDDYIPNEMLPADIFEQTPSPSKTKEFCFLPQNINNSMNDVTSPQSTPSKGGHSYTINQTHHSYTSQLRGDNRLMDNDNTSFKQESFTCSTDDEDSDISECDPGMDMLSNGFQIIPVNPDLDLSSDSSVKSSSRSSSPDNYSSSDSQCPVLQHALQKSMADDVDDENHERNDHESNVKEFLPVFPNIMEYCIQKTPENIRFNKIVAMNSPGQYKRQNKKSISLPQSPKHVPHTPSELDGLDLHTNLSFEDMKLLDFSEFVNGSPNSFNKKFDICEEFDTAASFSETRHFNQKRELKPTDLGVSKISADNKCKPIHPTSNDILSIIEKTTINEHELNTSDILFPCRMDDLEVGDFDLPSFIMDDLHVDSSCLLKDGLECSPIISKPIKYSSKIKNNSFDCNGSIDNLTDFPHINDNNDVKPISAVVSTPKLKTELFCSMDDNYQHYQNGKTQDSTIALTMNDENTFAMEKITCNGEVISLTAVTVDVSNASATDISKGDTEDFVDVETIDEGDSFTVLAANNVNALWEQFEATEELDIRNRSSTPSAVNNLGLNVLDKATEALSTKDKSQLMTLDGKKALPWSLPIRPYMVIPGMSKNKWQESPNKKHPKPEIVSPILLVKDHTVSLHNTSNKSIHLDHDYCSPVRIKQNNQSLIGNGHNESETDDLKDCQFVSPNRQDVTNLSSVYKMLNLSKQKLGLGKGKSISMCISKDVSTDEFTENSDNSLPPIKLPKSSSQTLKTVKLTPFKSDSSVHSKYSESDSDCSMSDHSYSKADFNKRLPECKNIADDNRKTFKRNSLGTAKDDFNSVDSNTQDTSSLTVSDRTLNFDENNSRNAQNLIVLKNGSERLTEMSKTSNGLINKSSFTKNNKNSLLINNINKNINGKESVIRKLVLNVNDRAPAIRQKQSLLKPTVRNEIKMVSLLKCNNEKNMPIECEKPVVKTEPKTVVIKTEENHENTISSNIIKGIDTVQPSNIVISEKLLKIEDQQIVIDNVDNIEQNTADKIDKKLPLKRKLNLEEYKKRRGNSTRSCETSRTCSPVICAPDNFAFSSPNSPAPIVEPLAKPAKVAESTPSLTQMLQNVLCNPKQLQKCPEVNGAPVTPVDKEAESAKKSETVNKKVFNPIADASKKALQLKKMAAQRSKDDKIILNKIPKIANNVILPMATENGKILPMTKNVDGVESDPISLAPTRRKNSDYEEIIMFSVGVNTNPVIIIDEIDEKECSAVESRAIDKSNILKPSIHFRIKQNKTKIVLQKNVFDTGLKQFLSSNSEQGVNNKDNFVETVPHIDVDKKMLKDLLKASKIDKNLESINATLEKVERRKDLKITSNSLIASIQDVVHKKNSKNSASRSPEVNATSVQKTSNTIIVKKEVDKKTVASKSRKLDEKILTENVRNSSDLSIVKKSDEVLIQDIFDITVIKQLLQDTDASEDKSNIAVLKLDHGEDKVIMHLKKDRVRPDTCTLAIQTDFNILIKDILENDDDLTVKEENDIDMNDNTVEVLDNSVDTMKKPDDKKDVKNDSKNDMKSEKEKPVEYAKKIQPDRSYRRRKDSLSSEASAENIDSANRRKDRRTSRDRYESSRKTNSRERHYRTSRSPGSSHRSANRSRSWGRYNRYNRNNRRQDVRHNRRSRSISRDRRKRNNSRDWNSYRPYISGRNSNSNRDRSRSRFNDRDDRSVRSVNSNSSKRKRLSSRSSHERQSSRLHTMKKSTKEPERTSISLDRVDHDLLEKEAHKSNDDVFVPSGEEPNVSVSKEISNLGSKPNRSRRRKSTECSNTSYASRLTKSSSRYSSDSEDNSSSSDSSSSSSSSSDSDSSDSDSEREFNSTDTKKTSVSSNRPKSELVEERRQVFVGRLESDLTKAELRMKFIKYGQVTEVTTHKKDDGSRYGFVTFGQAEQAYRVVERANADPDLKRYDVSFGGRRQFCRQFYSDLDDLEAVEDTEFYMAMAPRPIVAAVPVDSFDFLLEEMKAAMAKKSKDSNTRTQSTQGPRSAQNRAEGHCKV